MRQQIARTGSVRLDEPCPDGSPVRLPAADVRRRLCDTKYFGLRPKPLEQLLYRLRLPRSAERVFWLHWDAGNRQGDFCSELPISRVAQECCIDESSVTRAYQVLKAKGLLRRQDPGRDPTKPYCQATALTEVLIPRDALASLLAAPNRAPRTRAPQPDDGPAPAPTPTDPAGPVDPPDAAPPTALPPPPRKGDMKLALRALGKLSMHERARYEAYRSGADAAMSWDEHSALTRSEQELLTASVQRARYDRARAAAVSARDDLRGTPAPARAASAPPRPRNLTTFCHAYLRRKLTESLPPPVVAERLREVVWSIERGALAKLEMRLAMNVALKKMREGQWTRPHRMPPGWQLRDPA